MTVVCVFDIIIFAVLILTDYCFIIIVVNIIDYHHFDLSISSITSMYYHVHDNPSHHHHYHHTQHAYHSHHQQEVISTQMKRRQSRLPAMQTSNPYLLQHPAARYWCRNRWNRGWMKVR